jgi:hypothetical protein
MDAVVLVPAQYHNRVDSQRSEVDHLPLGCRVDEDIIHVQYCTSIQERTQSPIELFNLYLCMFSLTGADVGARWEQSGKWARC